MTRHARTTRLGRGRLALLLAASLAIGCAGNLSPGEQTGESGVSLASLPELPGCASYADLPHGELTATPLDGSDALYVAYEEGEPLCVDTAEGLALNLGYAAPVGMQTRFLGGQTSSDPMPGHPGNPLASGGGNQGSDPMPGRPSPSSAR